MRINITTPMSDDKERQRRNEVILAAIERHTEKHMNDDHTATSQPTQSDMLEAMERDRILKLFRGYADFLDAGADALPDLQAMTNIGGATHIRQLCDEIERNEHRKENQ